MGITIPEFFKITMVAPIFAIPLGLWYFFHICHSGGQWGHFGGFHLALPTAIGFIPQIKNLL